jgi:hypothetical protein
MPNACGFTAASYQDLADILCTVLTNIDAHVDSVKTDVDTLSNVVTDPTSGLPRILGNLNGLRDWVGDPGGGPTVQGRFTNVDAADAAINSLVTSCIGHVLDNGSEIGEVQTDLDEVNAAVGLAGGGKTAIIDAVQANGVISLIVGLANFAKSGGGSGTQDLVQWLLSMWNAPPLDVLSLGGNIGLGTDNSIAINSGVYGYQFSFTVPSYWGIRLGNPTEYIPYIARAAFRGTYGVVGDITHVLTPTVQVYPIPTGASTLQVHLETGVTGHYNELRFL